MKTARRWASLPVAISLVFGGCISDPGTPPLEDTGTAGDATIVDSGVPKDSGAGADGGVDAGPLDAGFVGCSAPDCDPREASSCADAGVCVLGDNAPLCVGEVGTKAAGAPCEATTDCLPGLACFARRDGAVCAQVCCPGDDADAVCEGRERCAGSGSLVDGTHTDWWSCVSTRSCDVLTPADVCEPDEGCYIVSPEGETDCRRGGDGQEGDDCVEQNDCASGFFCAGVTGGSCRRICSIGATVGAAACPEAEGNCQAYPYSPTGTGICTLDSSAMP